MPPTPDVPPVRDVDAPTPTEPNTAPETAVASDDAPTAPRLAHSPLHTADLLGQVVAKRYRMDSKIGAGGMGVVYRATQLDAGRQVALKVLHGELAADERIVKRFMIEMRATARIEHPNTVRLYDFGHTEEGHIFLAMEYLEGSTLAEEMKKLDRPMDPVRSAMLGAQIARGLAAAHAEGIIHRDLKPPNVMLSQKYGRRDLIKVLDFGIARFASAPADQDTDVDQLTSPGMVVGTVHFMAPEQMEGKAVDHRADLYALGCVLYYMVAGQAPFTGKSTVQVMYAQVNQAPRPPSQHNPDVPSWLDDTILRLLEKHPNRRFQSAAEVVVALEQGAGIFSRLTDAPPLPRQAAPTEELLNRTSINLKPPPGGIQPWMVGVAAGIGAGVGAVTAVLTTLWMLGSL